MAKLYFKYGAMGSSKSAQALITKFNYEELGMTVWLIKPSVDTRDGADIVKSRIGLVKKADVILPEDNIIEKFDQHPGMDVIIADECQFFTPQQIDQLRTLVDERDMPVICFGLRTDFLTHLFPGSRRLFEVADSIRLLNEAAPSREVLQLKAYERFIKAADGQATKIIIPSEIQGMAGLAASVKELVKD